VPLAHRVDESTGFGAIGVLRLRIADHLDADVEAGAADVAQSWSSMAANSAHSASPTVLALASRCSCSMTSSTADAAAMDTGLPPERVEVRHADVRTV
jgi:hypothetical protein